MTVTDRAPRRFGTALALCGAAALAVNTGAGIASGAGRASIVAPLAVAAVALLGLLALIRFAAFVLAVLLVRTALDAAKLDGELNTTGEAASSAVPGWLDPGAILGVGFAVIGVAWLAAQPPRRARTRTVMALPAAAVAMVAASALSLVGGRATGTAAGVAAGEVMRLAAMAVMLLVVERLVSDDQHRRVPLLAAVVASAVAPVATTVYQVGTGNGLLDVHGILRPHGTFWHPNVLGVYSALMLTVAVALLPRLSGRLGLNPRTGLVLLTCGLAVALVASHTRGAWLAAVAGLAVVAVLTGRRLLLVLGVAVLLPPLALPSVRARLTDAAGSAPGAPESSLTWRFEHWGQVLDLIGGNPVTGLGPGAARTALGKEVHNDYLRALAETGFVGLLAYLALLAAFVLTARAALQATADLQASTDLQGSAGPLQEGALDRGVAAGFAGAVAVLAVFAIADNVMTTVAVQWYVAALAGIALAIIRARDTDEPPVPAPPNAPGGRP
ncbi:O-antigen ligase family protein [Actinomadura soli]|uniref:O-antigen ligase family protein n=1 Tax=Actinomadura soli TaxID=2508997 RepID=A0A5C4J4I7_9ACTN|nr:O-antigen ligase family protein [Actinomadura soli]TMQ91780.1 O-antigen ligase family protein [Actinomadura soli]